MSIFRRLSISLMGGGTSSGDDEPRAPHRHRRSLHRDPKNYDVSPTGGNRPISITADPRLTFPAPYEGATEQNTVDGSQPSLHRHSTHHRHSSQHRHHHHHHTPRSSDASERPPRKHRSRSDAAAAATTTTTTTTTTAAGETPAPRRSSRSSRRRSGLPAEPVSPVSPIEVLAPPSVPIPISTQAINSNWMSTSPPSGGSSMGIVISGHRRSRGSSSSTPLITATPPTPSPLEQARRANTHPVFRGFPGGAPPPYPVTPPESRNGEQYIAYAVSKMAVGTPEHDSLLHRYRSNFDPRAGRAELSAEPEPVEIGSSESILQPSQPHRADSGKSFSCTHVAAPPLYPPPTQPLPPVPQPPQPPPPPQPSQPPPPPPVRRTKGSLRENQYDFLRTFDTVFVIDDSASMDAFTRWRDTRAALETIATVATKYDSDGIDVHFLNSTQHDAHNVHSAAEVRRLFDLVRPGGITPIAACLDHILRAYLDTYATARAAIASAGVGTARYPKPLNIIVLTDGEPTDDPESVIVDAARRLDALNAPLCQVGIQFFQIGDEEGAREALEDLDDALAGIYGIRDMVDYTPYIGNQPGRGVNEDGEAVTGEWILKVLTGAVNRRLDRLQNDHGYGRGR